MPSIDFSITDRVLTEIVCAKSVGLKPTGIVLGQPQWGMFLDLVDHMTKVGQMVEDPSCKGKSKLFGLAIKPCSVGSGIWIECSTE